MTTSRFLAGLLIAAALVGLGWWLRAVSDDVDRVAGGGRLGPATAPPCTSSVESARVPRVIEVLQYGDTLRYLSRLDGSGWRLDLIHPPKEAHR